MRSITLTDHLAGSNDKLTLNYDEFYSPYVSNKFRKTFFSLLI